MFGHRFSDSSQRVLVDPKGPIIRYPLTGLGLRGLESWGLGFRV